ncbi:Zinc finger CCHC domain-containing protein 9 [Amphibalanus amphitrite]|uniref:Zinc finger CCHC domain-containing protein 9 n=1 Tax=Amphibalanus amphitrite TaxID=1232801 RepID=A0A6A4VXL9_AMPAM|nr:Zinc finger CCHC domain-containing protein 9 [Amphibalanus amphitrite]
MKARQLAKKEKLMRQSSPATPSKPEPKRRRPKLPVRLENVELKYSEDDESMAQFEGMWVPREETGRLMSAREELEKRGLPAEKVNRRMKQLVRKEHRKLKLSMIAAQTKTERAARERRLFLEAQQTPRVRRRVPGRACGLTLQEGEQLARFDGFWVSAEAVPRLEALRQKLIDSGKTENEARRLLRKARRAEERKVKSSGRLLCTKCGGRGHLLTDCTATAVEPAAGTACFRCGEAGHRLSDCPKKGEIVGLPFATCFLCKKQGHMSRECPQAESGDAVQTTSQAGQRSDVARGGGQSWRGMTHDVDQAVVVQSAEKKRRSLPAAAPEQKPRVHIRFD